MNPLKLTASLLGVHPRKAFASLARLPGYLRQYRAFRKQSSGRGPEFPFDECRPYLFDAESDAGTACGHYFHQDLLVARRVFERRPARRLDIGSRIDGFVAHLAVFREVDVLDVRPFPRQLVSIRFIRADLASGLPDELAGRYDSVSCLHALEHFGLGRYGDALDPRGYEKGLHALDRALAEGGILFLSVPIGRQRVSFNAERVFSVPFLRDLVRERFRLIHFSYVDDEGNLHENVPAIGPEAEASFGCHYGCGILELEKTASGPPA